MACYVTKQNNCVSANQSGIYTCTQKIIYHRVFRALLLHIVLSTVCSRHLIKKTMVSLQYHICVVYCNNEYHLTVSRNKRNDILFIGKLSSAIDVWDSRKHFVCNVF